MRWLSLLLGTLLSLNALAAIDTYEFNDEAERQRFARAHRRAALP